MHCVLVANVSTIQVPYAMSYASSPGTTSASLDYDAVPGDAVPRISGKKSSMRSSARLSRLQQMDIPKINKMHRAQISDLSEALGVGAVSNSSKRSSRKSSKFGKNGRVSRLMNTEHINTLEEEDEAEPDHDGDHNQNFTVPLRITVDSLRLYTDCDLKHEVFGIGVFEKGMLLHGRFVENQQKEHSENDHKVVQLENYLFCSGTAVEVVDVVHEKLPSNTLGKGGGYRISVNQNGKKVSVIASNADNFEFSALQTYWQTHEGQTTEPQPQPAFATPDSLGKIPKNRVKSLRSQFSAMSKEDVFAESKQEVLEDVETPGNPDENPDEYPIENSNGNPNGNPDGDAMNDEFDDMPLRSSLFGGGIDNGFGDEMDPQIRISAIQQPEPTEQSQFVGGEIVRIHNLQNSAQFNGLVAEVMGHFDRNVDPEGGRWPIQIIQSGVQLAIKAENLETVAVAVDRKYLFYHKVDGIDDEFDRKIFFVVQHWIKLIRYVAVEEEEDEMDYEYLVDVECLQIVRRYLGTEYSE